MYILEVIGIAAVSYFEENDLKIVIRKAKIFKEAGYKIEIYERIPLIIGFEN